MANRRTVRLAVMVIGGIMAAQLAGCDGPGGGAAAARHDDHHHHDGHMHAHSGGSGLQFYAHQASDPDWLVAAGRFHGHLGPYVTVGTLIGRDARQRLATRGHWELEVICWMPPDRQRQPYSCILDGLQVSTGATMGKRNIRFDYSPQVVPDKWPVVYVIRRETDDMAAQGFAYYLQDELTEMLSHISPDRLEQISRDIAGHTIDELFEVRVLEPHQLGGGPG